MTRRAGIAGAHRAADHPRRAVGRARRDLSADRAVRQSPRRRAGLRAAGRRRRAAGRDASTDLDAARHQRLRARIGGSARRSVRRRRFHAGARRRARRTGSRTSSRRCPGRCVKGTRSASRSSAATSRWARPARSPTSTAIAIYAFGHPFFNLGPSQFPMTRAYVHTMLPSLMSSFKISSMGEVIGTMQQDRATAIAGTLGKGPTVIPMTVTLQSTREDGSATKRSFTYQVANDQVFTPLLSYIALANTISAYERQFGAATFSGQEPRPDPGAQRPDRGRRLHRRQRDARRRHGRRRTDQHAARQRPRAGDGQRRGRVDRGEREAAQRHHRARLARRSPAARRPHRAAQGVDPQLPRRREDLHRADRDSGERVRVRSRFW